MPSRAPRLCPSCGAAITERRCSRCHPAWSRKPQSWTAGSSRKWRTFRAAWLAQHPLCACIEPDCHGPRQPCEALAHVVDHIDGTDYTTERYNPDRVRSLCNDCHDQRTAQQGVEARRQ